jgi:hypothetical protein
MEGYLWALGAIALFLLALTNLPFLWWLIFPAVPLFQRGTRVVSRYMKGTEPVPGANSGLQAGVQLPPLPAQPLPTPPLPQPPIAIPVPPVPVPQVRIEAPRPPPQPAAPPDPRDARVDAICERILNELKTAPEASREIFRNPEQTVGSLRATCRELTRRERELRAFLSPAEDARLSKEREVLQGRVDAESDEVVKLRLSSALAALDQQRQQRAELAKSANRFEAEHTRIAYTLESLHTQVVRMRSADAVSADVAGAGLRQSLDNLTKEVDALADALERVNRGDEARLRTLAEAPPAAPSPPPQLPGAREKV